jgi:hypothetical protein
MAGDTSQIRRDKNIRGGAGPIPGSAKGPDDFSCEFGQSDMRYALDIRWLRWIHILPATILPPYSIFLTGINAQKRETRDHGSIEIDK